MKCCTGDEIAGRAGGDEFYIFAKDYTEGKLKAFTDKMTELLDSYNSISGAPYKVELSWGGYITQIDNRGRLEALLSESDSRMYRQKQSKPNRRK